MIQLLTNVITANHTSPSLIQQGLGHQLTEKFPLQQQNDHSNRVEKRKGSPKSNKTKKSPSNFYSLLAQIHNINDLDETE